ncbi:MAG: class I SAM-dependent RNA methyltransferase [Calditrichia bacterium]
MEEPGAEELAELGATKIRQAYRGLYFEADQSTVYRINYNARLITRVLAPLTTFKCHNTDYLYRQAKEIQWTDFLSAAQTFAVFAHVAHSKIRHSRYAALRLKDAIVDYFRDSQGRRPAVNRNHPDVWFNLHIENDRATISVDTSGGSLHRRGYRSDAGPAPMQETVAAAIIRMMEWDGSRPLYDPMCGSGTLLSEALMSHCEIPAGYLRKRFGFESLPDFNPQLWHTVKNRSDQKIRNLTEGFISGSDISRHEVDMARKNLRSLPSGGKVRLAVKDFRKIEGLENHIIVCNPPYGIRLGEEKELENLYKAFGDFLKQRCKNSIAYVYFGNRALIPKIGLKPSWKKELVSGGLDGRLVKIELY